MNSLTSERLRELFYAFCESKLHNRIPNESLIPQKDKTVLFTNSGMLPIIDYLAGTEHPLGKRLYNIQKVIRTGAIDKVGDPFYETCFEVFGMWSLGDYYKEEAYNYVIDFISNSKYLNIQKDRLFFTCYAGDELLLKDTESFNILVALGISASNIFFSLINRKGPYGELGLYGYNTRIYYDTGLPFCSDNCNPYCNCGKFTEIWDVVFFELSKKEQKVVTLLPRRVVDMGAGFDRILTLINSKESIFDTDLFADIIITIERVTQKKYIDYKSEFRIIADHLRASTFILAESKDIKPSNHGQGYVLRRLIRRALRSIRNLSKSDCSIESIAKAIIFQYGKIYSDLVVNQDYILEQLLKEEKGYNTLLLNGKRTIKRIVDACDLGFKLISGEQAFFLFTSLGVPIELTEEIAREYGCDVDIDGFNILYQNHKTLAKKNGTVK